MKVGLKVAVAGFALIASASGCGVGLFGGERVCGILPQDVVVEALGSEDFTVRGATPPARLLLGGCHVRGKEAVLTVGGMFLDDGSAANMIENASAGAVPLAPSVEGMVAGHNGWLLVPCPAQQRPFGVGASLGATERAPEPPDRRDALARVIVAAVDGFTRLANCDTPQIPDPERIAPAPTPKPLHPDSRACGMLDGAQTIAALDPSRSWEYATTPQRPAPVEVCAFSVDGTEMVRLAVAQGTLARAAVEPSKFYDPRYRLSGLPGEGWADASSGWLRARCDGEPIVYSLSTTPENAIAGIVSAERLLRAFVAAASQREGCPID